MLNRRFAILLVAACGMAVAQSSVPVGQRPSRQTGVLFVKTPIYDTVQPTLPFNLDKPAILIFSKTNGFREEKAMLASDIALVDIAEAEGWSYFVTENAAVFNPEQLKRFQVVVWNNTSGDLLTEEQRAAFKSYVEGGGGFVGVHGAGGDPKYEWKWYVDTLIGAQFVGHPMGPQFQQATVKVEVADDPAMKKLPASWSRVDEWYSFAASPRGKVEVLASLDEGTYSPKSPDRDLKMGDHPIIWKHCVGKGRVFYSALGHSASAYAEPMYLEVLRGAIAWAAGVEGKGCAVAP
jgi:type 1 glutamine amidotransferase